jgi:hypothetical protein
MVAVFSCALYVSQRTESEIDESHRTQPLSLSDSLFTVIGIICQEGLSFYSMFLMLSEISNLDHEDDCLSRLLHHVVS